MSSLADYSQNVLEQTDIFACRGCLATDVIFHDLKEKDIYQVFAEFTGSSVHQSDGYPQFVCSTCLFLLRKFVRFRRKCLTAMQTLQQMKLSGDIINTDSIKSIDRTRIKHNYQKQNVFDINIIDRNEVDNLFDEIQKKLDNILDEDTSEDEIIQIAKRKPVKHQKEVQNQTKDVTEKVFVTVKQEHIDSDDSFPFFDVDNNEDFEGNEPSYSVKEEDPTPKKRTVKRKVKDIKLKLVNVKDKPKREKRRRKETEEIGEEEEEVNEDWRKIIEEIKEEISTNKLTKRKIPSKADIQSTLRKAKKFALENNVELKFLTKEEQKLEIEEKRNSEDFHKAPYKCEKCCKVFNSEETFANHSFFHSGGDYACEICMYCFRTRLQYKNHFYVQHTKKMTCKECGLIHRSWTKARQHYLWHQGNNLNISCEQCGLRFALRKNYLNHVRNTHGGGVNGPQCLLCDRAFYNEKGLQLHMIKTHKDKPCCSTCSVVFASTDALGVHVNVPQGCQPGYSSCPTCGNNFTNENEMKTHHNDEHRKNYYKCEQCRKTFKDFEKYTTHLNYHMRASEVVEGLADCPNRMKSRGEKKVFVCEVCGMEKRCMAMLQEHQRTHTGETPYRCNFCQKTFKQKQNLKMHIATHTGEKKYKCPICQKAFRQMQHRTSHMLTHTKERPYACAACPKRYTGASALKDHVNTAHLGLPPRKWGKKKEAREQH